MSRSSVHAPVLAVCTLFVLGTAALRGQEANPAGPRPSGVVFAIDGSGLLRGISDDLRTAIADAGLGLPVETFAWSHGAGRVLADLHAHDHQKAKGDELARLVLAHRKGFPTGRIYLVCHSSGAAIVLAAAKALPVGCVDRIVLLAPALSPGCDLRPALRCARQGVDSFHSANDMVGRVLALVGNADGQFLISAGCAGFRTPGADALYGHLRQRPWDPQMTRSGYFGGHFGCTRAGFLRTYVVPLLDSD